MLSKRTMKPKMKLKWLLLAFALWLLGPAAPVLQDMPLLNAPKVMAQGAIPDPALPPRTGDCSIDNIYYGAIPPGGEKGRVIVFVHGYNGLASDWWTAATTAGLNDMYVLAYNAGYRTAFVNTNVNLKRPPDPQRCLVTTRRTSYDMFNNGAVLSKQIKAISEHYGVPKLDIVAHSKGGTDAQTAVVWFNSWRYVRTVFTLGTPHQGSLLADLVWSPAGRELRAFIGNRDRATLTMRTPFMQLYRLFTDVAKADDFVQYYNGAGNFWNQPESAFEITGAWLQERPKGGDNDGAVTVASTLLPYAKPLFLEPWSHSQIAIGSNAFPYIHAVLQDDFTPPSSIEIAGPSAGTTGHAYEFTAYLPITITRPVEYTWQATGQTTVHSPVDGSSSTVTFAWNEPGTKQVTVEVSNGTAKAVSTHEIVISPPAAPANLQITGPVSGDENEAYTFHVELPASTTAPVTYSWRATGQVSMEKTSDTHDSLTFTWDQPGRKEIEVVATNQVGFTTATHIINIGEPTAIDDDTEQPQDPSNGAQAHKLFIAQLVSDNPGQPQPTTIDTLSEAERTQLIESNQILRGGEVAGSATAHFPIEVGVADATFTLLTTDPGVQAVLVSPDGTRHELTPVAAESDSVVADISAANVVVGDATDGIWQIHLHSTAPAGYLLAVSLNTPFKVYLQGIPARLLFTGSTIRVNAYTNTAVGNPVLKQIAWIIDEGKDDLEQDHESQDNEQASISSTSAAGSTMQEVVPSSTGIYELGVTVTGEVNGSAFERTFVQPLLIFSEETDLSISSLKGLFEQWYCESGDCSELP